MNPKIFNYIISTNNANVLTYNGYTAEVQGSYLLLSKVDEINITKRKITVIPMEQISGIELEEIIVAEKVNETI